MIYDNGNYNEPQVSRAVEYALDPEAMTATRVWQFVHPENIYAPSMGGAQRLSNGNTLINWGNIPNDDYGARVTEVDANGNIVLEFVVDEPFSAYRAHKFDWFFDSSVVGCGDPNALNYDATASVGDSTLCTY